MKKLITAALLACSLMASSSVFASGCGSTGAALNQATTGLINAYMSMNTGQISAARVAYTQAFNAHMACQLK